MSNNNQLQRAARDRLIDLLGFGFTYPLTDLNIADKHLKVPVDQPAKIPIELSQSHVTYQLHDKDEHQIRDEPNGQPFEVSGNSGEALLKTPSIPKEVTYKIWARKDLHNNSESNQYSAYLQQTAEVKVGLDTDLKARILGFPFLDTSIVIPEETNARIIPYNQVVTVQIDSSQEGVKYQLFLNREKLDATLSEVVTGLGSNKAIEITSTPIKEDQTIHIRMVKTYDAAENQDDDIDWLKITLAVKVRANPDLAVKVAPASIVDYQSHPEISIASSQASTRYRVYLRPVSDSEFVFPEAPNNRRLIKVAVPGHENVQLLKPARTEIWSTPPAGYSSASSWKEGNGQKISIPLDKLGALETDSLIIVQAEKLHLEKGKTIASSVQLKQAAVILVRPNPSIPLTLRIPVTEVSKVRSIQVFKGQRGVFYSFQLGADGDEMGLPAYFHQWASSNRPTDKGLEQLRLGVDFVVANSDSPQTPVLDISENLEEGVFHINARKAMTHVSTDLAHSFPMPKLSQFQPQPIEVTKNTASEIQILQSKASVSYQLLLNKIAVGGAINGNGSVLKLPTETIEKDTLFTVRSTHSLEGGVVFELDQTVEVKIKVN